MGAMHLYWLTILLNLREQNDLFERILLGLILVDIKVREKAKIRNQYNQTPHLTRDTT